HRLVPARCSLPCDKDYSFRKDSFGDNKILSVCLTIFYFGWFILGGGRREVKLLGIEDLRLQISD
ncbi:MAG TPA: hypothetical protein VLE19_15255, partial [Pyrinomonadaceae bacterium]|nr:hypothetical protein [Pyrinomonadaceae bacterium]